MADKQIWGADFNYAKYSSKMPNLLAGETPNVFSDRFAGGSLMDLGIYPLYAAVRLFKKAYKMHASNGILFNHESPIRDTEVGVVGDGLHAVD